MCICMYIRIYVRTYIYIYIHVCVYIYDSFPPCIHITQITEVYMRNTIISFHSDAINGFCSTISVLCTYT